MMPSAQLNGVSGTAWNDVWAVGFPNLVPGQPVVIHWNGQRWATSQQEPVVGELHGVVAISPADAWAVGYSFGADVNSLAMHWDGSMWRLVPTPDLEYDFLYDVSATSSTDVWAVGFYDHGGAFLPLVLHWDGNVWRRVPAPAAQSNANVFYGVDAVARDDVWAVGYRQAEPFILKPLIEHWNGKSWTVVASPRAPGRTNILHSVSAVSPSLVWAVGTATPERFGAVPLIERWDGVKWNVVPPPSRANAPVLFDVRSLSADDAWAVGDYTPGSYQHPYTVHWDGRAWTPVAAPARGQSSSLFSVAAISATDIWAVGTATDSGRPLLAEHLSGCPAR